MSNNSNDTNQQQQQQQQQQQYEQQQYEQQQQQLYKKDTNIIKETCGYRTYSCLRRRPEMNFMMNFCIDLHNFFKEILPNLL
uniref:Uncharacterized protein n=1 Tax=Glossina austeni TaxID=7395 RepID=A0A1A9VBB1_GLOAU